MWIFKWIFGALLIIIILGFAIQNQEQAVSVHIVSWESPVVPLYLIVFLSFIAGMITWFAVSIFKIFSLKQQNFTLQREAKKVKDELNRLRNASIEEEIETSDLQESDETTEPINKTDEE